MRGAAEAITFGPLSYGAANLGNLYRPLTDEQAWQILETAWDAGIRAFDTAPHYGLGLSERRLGRALAGRPRDEYVVSTKVGRLLVPNPHPAASDDDGFAVPGDLTRRWDFSAAGVERSLEESLTRLGLDAVDILFADVARVFGPAALGIVLTGMGQDGTAGAKALVDAGSGVLVQDEATSVVWGMPGAVAAAGLADVVLPLNQIGRRIAAMVASAGLGAGAVAGAASAARRIAS